MPSDMDDFRLLARLSNKSFNRAENQRKKNFNQLLKIMAPTNAERQKQFRKCKKAAGLKRIDIWVKADPKYTYAGADIHAENLGICARDEKVLVMFECFSRYMESEGVSPELREDMKSLFKIFGFVNAH